MCQINLTNISFVYPFSSNFVFRLILHQFFLACNNHLPADSSGTSSGPGPGSPGPEIALFRFRPVRHEHGPVAGTQTAQVKAAADFLWQYQSVRTGQTAQVEPAPDSLWQYQSLSAGQTAQVKAAAVIFKLS